MDGYQLAASLVSSLTSTLAAFAWPAAIVIVAAIFKQELSSLLERVEVAKTPGTEFRFRDRVKEVEQATQAIEPAIGSDAPAPLADPIFTELLSQSPSSAVVYKWQQVLNQLRNQLTWQAPSQNGMKLRQPIRFALAKKHGTDAASLFDELRDLNKIAATEGDNGVSTADAIRFSNASDLLLKLAVK